MRPSSIALGVATAALAAGGVYLLLEARRESSPTPVARNSLAPPVIAPPVAEPPVALVRPPAPPTPPRRPPPPPPTITAPALVEAPPPPMPPPVAAAVVTTVTGLQYQDQRVGTGPAPRPGQTIVVHYTGWLDAAGGNGAKFDSSRDRGEPMAIPFGKGVTIPGWDEGLSTMRVGGLRTLVVPAALGYGDHGSGEVIPPGAVLRFEIELIDVKDP